MKTNRWILFAMMVCLVSIIEVKAQYYDGPDDIWYYVQCDENGKIYGKNVNIVKTNHSQCRVFNFDGRKACVWSYSIENVQRDLQSNPSHFEEMIETTEYDLKYTSNDTYRQEYDGGRYTEFHFSNSRSSLTVKYHYTAYRTGVTYMNGMAFTTGPFPEEEDEITYYKKVEKSFFKIGRSRTSSSTLYD